MNMVRRRASVEGSLMLASRSAVDVAVAYTVAGTTPVKRIRVDIAARVRRRMVGRGCTPEPVGAVGAVGCIRVYIPTRVWRWVNWSGRTLDAVGGGGVGWGDRPCLHDDGGVVGRDGSRERFLPKELLHDGASSVSDGSVTGVSQWGDSHCF